MNVLTYAEVDIFGAIILYLFWRNQRRSGSQSVDDRFFSAILAIGIAILLLDGVLWMLDGVQYPGSRQILKLLTGVSYLLSPALSCLWLMYCDVRVFMDARGLKMRARFYVIPLALHLILLVVNQFTPIVFYIDAQSMYHRRPLFFVYWGVSYLYLLSSMLLVLYRNKRSQLNRRELHYFTIFPLPLFVGGFLQLLFYGYSLVWPGLVISLAILYINVLNGQISTDALTGLNNRRKLSSHLNLKINSADSHDSLYLLMIDADNFKGINDTYGHSAGDRALIQIAGMMREACKNRRDCFLARIGGDEFIIVGQNAHSGVPEQLADDIHAEVQAFNLAATAPYTLSLSIGTARFSTLEHSSADALLNAADQSMYLIKSGKKGSAHGQAR